MLALLPTHAAAQESDSPAEPIDWSLLPDTPAAVAFGAFAELMQENDRSLWLPFVEDRVEPSVRARHDDEAWIGILAQLEHQWQTLDLAWVGTDSALRFGLVGRRRDDPLGEWFELSVSVSPRDETLITDLDTLRASAPAGWIAQPLDGPGLAREIAAYVDGVIESGLFSGAILVADRSEVLLERVAGLASLRYGVPNRETTRFCLGSMTKMFTACAILGLVERGELALDAPIGKYLGEEWVGPEAGERIRVEHLLTHSGGTGDFFLHPGYAQRTRSHFRSVGSFAEFIDVQRPEFEPGSRHEYSNSGFILLGAILEAVTGREYHDYMREAFYGRVGMSASDCFDWDSTEPDLATGYYETPEGSLRSNEFSQRARGCPAGSSYSTTRDLLTFARRFQSGEIVSPATVAAMTSPHPELGSDAYGFGMELFQREPALRAFGHSGGGPGVHGLLVMYPDSGHVVIVLANAETRNAFVVGLRLHELIARLQG